MDTWYVLELGDALVAHSLLAEIAEAHAALAGQGNSRDRAVFTRHDTEGRLSCAVTAYFSPAAADLAARFAARPCPQPRRTGLDLLAGDPLRRDALFDDATPAPRRE